MSQSFFNLTPANDVPDTDDDPHFDYCASLTEKEHDAFMKQAMDLADQLFETINTTQEAQAGALTYGVILECLRFMTWSIEQDMAVENADA